MSVLSVLSVLSIFSFLWESLSIIFEDELLSSFILFFSLLETLLSLGKSGKVGKLGKFLESHLESGLLKLGIHQVNLDWISSQTGSLFFEL